ncbi:MAG: TonB-dependent receptor [Opitutaceae bacterium]|nr:TonB-dependent receptor [Opitutaceae bacterium]
MSRPIHAVTLLAALASVAFTSAGRAADAAAKPKDETVQLDKFAVIADKQANFSLPLDAVAGTGSRLGLANRDLPASVSVITQEVIQLRGLRTAVEAVEAAVGMTGGTQFGSIPGYSTRGFSANNITVMRDGIRQNTASQSSRQIDAFNLDRVEILKGPSSLMFGEGALGGAVNYVSKAPDRRFRGEAFASLGAWNTVRLGFGLGGPIVQDVLSYRFDVSHASTDGYVDRNGQDYTGFSGALGWQITPKLTLTAYSTYLRDSVESYYGTPVIYDAVVNTTAPVQTQEVRKVNTATDRLINPRIDARARRTNYNIEDNFAKTENSFHRVRADFAATPGIDVRNEAYVATQLLKWRNLENNTWNPVTQRVDLGEFALIYRDDLLVGDRFDVTFKSDLAGRKNRLLIGGDVSRNDLTRGSTPGNVATTLPSASLLAPTPVNGPAVRVVKTARIAIKTAALFVEDVLDITPQLKLVGGLRYDDIVVQRDTLANPTTTPATPFSTFEKTYRPWTGRAGAVWSATRELNLYASYSRAAEPVTQLVSLTSARADFSLQKGRQFEVGAKQTFWNGKADATLAFFDIEKKDLLTQTVVNGVRVSQQIGAIVSRGAELALALSPGDGWRIEANAAYTEAEYRDFNENLGAGVVSRAGNTPPAVPEWVANLFVAKKFGHALTLSGGPRHVARRAANNNNGIWSPGYTTLDAAASYAWERWTFTLRGRNLLDREYEDFPTAAGAMRRLADPRNAELTVRLAF